VSGNGGGTATHGFGIVGCGVISAIHADAIAAIPDARLVAATDVLPERAAAFAQARGCVAEPDLDELLARNDIDVVSVCVPSGLHAEVGIQAAKAGKHLVIEKPVDVSLDAADRLIEAADAAGVRMTVISQHRFDPGLVELRELLDQQTLGRLVLGEVSTKWYRSQAYYDSAAWRGTWALDGGALMNQGIHYIDLLRWTMGPVAEVTAVCATQAHKMEAEDTGLAVLKFRSGAVGTIVTSTAVIPGFAQRLEISGTGGTVVIEDGMIAHRTFTAEVPDIDMRGTRALRAAAESVAAPAPAGAASHSAQIADLLAAIDAGCQPAITGESGRAALEIVRAIYQSAREGRTMVL
jgi:UDP-N-acetyl-2-amino-2-deoxyglucuronate dehydrogenase